jgi:hypothetical protein
MRDSRLLPLFCRRSIIDRPAQPTEAPRLQRSATVPMKTPLKQEKPIPEEVRAQHGRRAREEVKKPDHMPNAPSLSARRREDCFLR